MQEITTKPRLLHAKPEFVFRGRNFTVTTLCDLAGDVFLSYYTGNAAECREDSRHRQLMMSGGMPFVHPSGDAEYRVLSAVILSDELADTDTLTYRFENEAGIAVSPLCTVEVCDGDGTVLPPLIVTELYLRPKGLGVSAYIEVANPTGEPVDLHDYRIAMWPGEGQDKKPKSVLPLATEPGKEILAPGEVAVLWPLFPANHNHPSGKYTSVEGFIEDTSAQLPPPLIPAVPGEVRIIPVEASRFDDEKGVYVLSEGVADFPVKEEKTTIAFLSNDADTPVYTLVYNRVAGNRRDTPVRHSSLWGIDLRHPTSGEVLFHRARITPGRLHPAQCLPRAAAEYPSVVPLDAGRCLSASESPLRLSFAVVSGEVCGITVNVKGKDGTPVEIEAERGENSLFYAVLPEGFADDNLCVEYFVILRDPARKSILGSLSEPFVTRLIDDRGPAVISVYPSEGYACDDTRTPTIKIRFKDPSGVRLKESILCVDKDNVSAEALWEEGSVSWTPKKPLKYGQHNYEILLRDKFGNKTYRKVVFSVVRPDELNFYCGEVHSHTSDSDGLAGPAEALAYARDVGKVDFFSVTEHSHYMDKKLYDKQRIVADSFDAPGKFAALYGWEMTWNGASGLWGHMNILNTDWIVDDVKKYGLPEIYTMLKKDPNAVAMFNHPGLPWGNFCDYSEYSPEVDRKVCLVEIKGAGYDREYMNLLAHGWHAAPVCNEDNHGFNWTTRTASTTFVLAPALTRDNILDAFRRRRTYSSADPTMKILYRINGMLMGSTIRDPEKLNISIDIKTESEGGIGTIQIVAEDNIIVKSINAGALRSYHGKIILPAEFDYYYLRITSPGKYTVTAPVWIEYSAGIKIKSLERRHKDNSYKPNRIIAKVKCHAGGVLKNVTADFYLVPSAGFDLEGTLPYASVTVPEIPKGKCAAISCAVPDIEGARRVSVVVRGYIGKRRYANTAMLLLSPVRISEICAKTSRITDAAGNVVENPFGYIQLHNVTNRDIKLDGWCARLWSKTGKAPLPDRILKLDGLVIPAGGILTIWRVPKDSGLTAEDFNRHHGVMMREGVDLIPTEIAIISGSGDARRIDIMCGNETISRVEYNFGSRFGRDVIENRAIVFDRAMNSTGTSRPVLIDALPSPAALRVLE